MIEKLKPAQLKAALDLTDFGFKSTADIDAYTGIIGQNRASKALEFGLSMKMKGYNIYACGQPGCGKTTFAEIYARQAAVSEETPPDLCYVYNFKNPKVPKLMKIPPGAGKTLRDEMSELINRLSYELPRVFGAKSLESKRTEIFKKFQVKREEVLRDMTEEAKQQNFGVKTTNSGIYFMPIVDGEIISEEQFDALSQEQKDEISKNSESIQAGAAEAMRIIKEWEKNVRKDVDDLEYSVGLFEVGRIIGPLLQKYTDSGEIFEYIKEVKEDILENISCFLEEESDEEEAVSALMPWYSKKNHDEFKTKYAVNVLADNSETKGAPVIVDFNPTYTNLVGEVEYDNEYGNLTTDFMKIKPGIFHKANGGYLILQAHDVLTNIQAWETIKRVLKTGEAVTEPLREYTTGLALSGVKPEPVPVDIKIIMCGSYFYYDILTEFDDDFKKLFKITADFDYEMKTSDDNIKAFCGFVKRFVNDQKMPEFEVASVAKVLEYAMRMAERQDKLSANFSKITEILAEACGWAKQAGAGVITPEYVEKAILEKEMRSDMYEEKLSEMIENDIIMIETSGKKVGQINGLAVLDVNDYMFAKPTRITATSYVGKAGIVNIEKEAEMSGSIHDKGVQVLSGYLGQTYAQDFPLSLSCRICFEQNYSGIDGDSASSTELYAVLSSLSGLPINQEIANTGSINQYGDIQPIGGVTYKIEGFFDLCKKRGLSGAQGVIIPRQNIRDLMLKDEVIQAVEDGMFHIYAISHVDEGIELLTGAKAGARSDKGRYPANSVHGLAYKKLKDYHKKATQEE